MQANKPRVEERMKELGIGYTALAAAIGISSAYLSDILMGRRGQRRLKDIAPLLAKALKLPVAEIVNQEVA